MTQFPTTIVRSRVGSDVLQPYCGVNIGINFCEDSNELATSYENEIHSTLYLRFPTVLDSFHVCCALVSCLRLARSKPNLSKVEPAKTDHEFSEQERTEWQHCNWIRNFKPKFPIERGFDDF